MHDVISQVIRFYWRKCAEANMERHLCFEYSLLFKGVQKSGGKMEPGRRCCLAPLLCGEDRLVPFCQAFIPLDVWGKRSEEHTSELQSRGHLVCRLLLEKKNNTE